MRSLLLIIFIFISSYINAQTINFNEEYENFKKQYLREYNDYRNRVNKEYADFVRKTWKEYKGYKTTPIPDDTPIPPKPYNEKDKADPITVSPEPLPVPTPQPQPEPIEPIHETPIQDGSYLSFDFYGTRESIRFPKNLDINVKDVSPTSIAKGWEALCVDEIDNTILDCLEARKKYNLCDWAYFLYLDKVGKIYSNNPNEATLLTAFLYVQSGYQMRLALDGNQLKILFGSKHHIYDLPYYVVDGVMFYPFGNVSNSIKICNAEFEGETPMSLFINSEQLLGDDMSNKRNLVSERYPDISVSSQVPTGLISFYNDYPSSQIGDNPLTRWAMYAQTPLASKTKNSIYPKLKEKIKGCSEFDAANRLLNWVQTAFVYEYDDKIWGHDRAFFAEETLYYPYCDCEDRSILFSRLIRDLLDLDVALIYYPGHLATAVAFKENVEGDVMMINGRKFAVCDPTYIGAPVGVQMPDLDYSQTQAIVLKR